MDSPDVIHGRMKEGAHIAGYSLQRAMENLRWLLEDSRYEQLGAGHKNVNDFLRDTEDAFKLLNIKPEERKQIAALVKELQPKASQRAIGDMLDADHATIAADLGTIERDRSGEIPPVDQEIQEEEQPVFGEISPPAIPPDDYDAVKGEQRKQDKEKKQKEREEEIERIESRVTELPDGEFEVIAVDPPWPYGTKYNPEGRRAANPYPEMSLHDIAEIELPASSNCILWLWTTHKFMRHAFDILDYWGFRDVSILTWVKDRMGLGQWLRSQSEFCIMAVKGSPIIKLTNQTTVIRGPMREHSRKPDEFYLMVDGLCVGRKLDYFSREQRDGWETFGNEQERFNGME